jgi:signal transduction histidine kinase
MKRSLRWRLTLGALLAIGLSLLAVWLILDSLFYNYVLERYRTDMTVLSDSIAARLDNDKGKLVLNRHPADPRLDLPAGGRYWQVNVNGAPVLRSRSLWDTELPIQADAKADKADFFEASGPDGEVVLVLQRQSRLADEPREVTFQVSTAFARSELDAAVGDFRKQLGEMLGITALLLVIASIVQISIGLKPLDSLKKNISLIRIGKSRSLPDDGPLEVSPLIREINLLLEERTHAVERARARASDLAHGLKTPLTVLAHLADHLDGPKRDIALQQVELVRQRADRQLQAARMGVEQMATTDLATIAAKLVQVLMPLAQERGLTIEHRIAQGIVVQVDPADMAEALGNILDNAVKWATSRIVIAACVEAGHIALRVSDDGPGVESDQVGKILRRGAQGDAALEGHGLGLAISADIAEAYGGSLRLGPSKAGGLQAEMQFPQSATRQIHTPS